MADLWIVSDTHFGHANILNFVREDGSRVRTFDSVTQMDEHMIDCWNSVVKPQDKVYHLGDVAMNKMHIATVARCNGHKRLVRGNHDDHDLKMYLPHFEEVYGSRRLDGVLMTHIPVHPDSIGGCRANVHGHVHNNLSALKLGPKYFNVSVEVIDYTPLHFDELKKRIRMQKEESISRCIV